MKLGKNLTKRQIKMIKEARVNMAKSLRKAKEGGNKKELERTKEINRQIKWCHDRF